LNLDVTNFNLAVYVVNVFLILLQTVGHDCHQVEMYLLSTVSVQIIIYVFYSLLGHNCGSLKAVGWVAGRRPACKKLSGEVPAWLSVCSEVQMICISSS